MESMQGGLGSVSQRRHQRWGLTCRRRLTALPAARCSRGRGAGAHRGGAPPAPRTKSWCLRTGGRPALEPQRSSQDRRALCLHADSAAAAPCCSLLLLPAAAGIPPPQPLPPPPLVRLGDSLVLPVNPSPSPRPLLSHGKKRTGAWPRTSACLTGRREPGHKARLGDILHRTEVLLGGDGCQARPGGGTFRHGVAALIQGLALSRYRSRLYL